MDAKIPDEERKRQKTIIEKTKGKDLEKKFDELNREAIEEAKRQFMPPVITEPKCKVCTSPHRDFIEWALLKNYSYESIERKLPFDSEGNRPSRKSIANHYKEHMKIEDEVARREMEAEAERIGKSVDRGAERIHTERGILRALIQKAFSDAQDGTIVVEARDLIQMMKLQREIEEKTSDVKLEQERAYLSLIIRAVKETFSQNEWIRLQKKIQELRVDEGAEDTVPQLEEASIVE